ncbi:MAG: hypothetical protein ACLFPH_06005 [Bacteroidales bacterium]
MNSGDNTLKLIEKLSDVLSYLLELKKRGQYQKGIKLIDDTLLNYLEFDSSETNILSEKFIEEVTNNSGKLTHDIVNSIGDLLNEKGELLYNQNRLKESKEILKNALTIYFFLNDQQDIFSFERMNKMVLINNKLSKIDLQIES